MRKIWKKTAATMMAATLISMTGCTVSIRFERPERRTLPEKLSSTDEKWGTRVSINELVESDESDEEETLPEETSAIAVEDSFVIPMPPQYQ